MLDYPFTKCYTDRYGWINLVEVIIASNLGYKGYEQAFRVPTPKEEEL
jgi:hypothetical protein